MLLFTAVVLFSAFSVMYGIRQDEGDLTMDAEQLLTSVNQLLEMSQRHLTEEEAVVSTTPAAVASQVAVSTPQETVAPVSTPVQATRVAPTATPAVSNALRSMTMTISGSISLESMIVDGAYDRESGSYKYGEILAGISDDVHADLNIAILESVFTADASKRNDMIAPSASLDALTAAGFDGVVLSAENALAGGEKAVRETLDILQRRGMIASGLYLPESTQHINMLQINGMQLALLAYTDSLSQESKNSVRDLAMQNAMIDTFNETRAITDITAARQRGAHAVVVFLHWGNNQATEPTAEQKRIAQALCDAGANVIIGSHSRAVQTVDRLISSDGGHQTLVAWSLGTLLSEDRDTREVVSGTLLHVQLTHDVAANKTMVGLVEYSPTYAWRQEENGLQKYRVVLSAEAAPVTMIQKQRDIMSRALTLIQTTMSKGIAIQRQ